MTRNVDRRIVHRIACGLAAVLLALTTPGTASAQPGGTIAGTVEDEGGLVLPGVAVSARNVQTMLIRVVTSDGRGRYEITGLAAGAYEVRGVLPGFRSETVTVRVTAGGAAQLDMVLAIAPLD